MFRNMKLAYKISKQTNIFTYVIVVALNESKYAHLDSMLDYIVCTLILRSERCGLFPDGLVIAERGYLLLVGNGH